MAAKKYAYINKEMLVWARSKTPFSELSDIEEKIKGISPEKLASWENGEDLPSIREAKELAKLYRVPLACFYLSEPPKTTVAQYKDRRTMGDTGNYKTSYNLWSEIRRITYSREQLLDFVDFHNKEIMPIPLLKENASIQETANILREFLGLDSPFRSKSAYKNNAFRYYRNIFENHGIMVAQVYKVDLFEMKGLSLYYDSFSIVAVNSADYERAKVFSLFHELAHLIRRSSSLCLMEFTERNDREEKICDKIAAETLMPEEQFRSLISETSSRDTKWSSSHLQTLGDKFGVSSLAVLLRLFDLNIIKNQEYYKIYQQSQAIFEEKRKNSEEEKEVSSGYAPPYATYLNKHGSLFPRVVLDAHARGDITYGEMRRTLGVGKKTIRDIELAVMAT
jgi:Zn-dependent peptidase ImmA (M78 family)/DNA-binding XRE family transcriptional regulator